VDALLARGLHVTLLDMGARGPGGRASTRRTPEGHVFDHGAQFVLRRSGGAGAGAGGDAGGDAAAALFASCAEAGVLAPWAGRLGALHVHQLSGVFTPRGNAAASDAASAAGADFFGFLSPGAEVWAGAPCSDALAAHLARERPRLARAFGTRVTAVHRDEAARTWRLQGVVTPRGGAAGPTVELGTFHALVAADASLARAGTPGATTLADPQHAAALPPGVAAAAAAMAAVPRTPLYSLMIVLPRSLTEARAHTPERARRGSITIAVVLLLRCAYRSCDSRCVRVCVRRCRSTARWCPAATASPS
jgi:hypothetical protein